MAVIAPTQDKKMQGLRLPPQAIEAEQSVLGGLMLSNEAWDKIADRIYAEDFYLADHRLIFSSISTLSERNKPFDVVTLSDELEAQGLLNQVGGLAYLSELVKETPTAANIIAYADIVRERAVLRKLISVSTDIAEAAFSPEGRSCHDILDLAETKVFEIADVNARNRRGYETIRTLVGQAVDRIDALYHQDSPITGVSTGYSKLDDMTAGLQPSDLIIVAGRPSMGKTSFAMNIAEQAAIRNKVPVGFFSLEMSGEQLALRMLSSLGRIDQTRVRTGQLQEQDWPRLTSAVSILSEAPIFIDDTPAITPTELRAKCRRLSREHGLGLIVIDYLQLMRSAGFAENRTGEISEISRSLKALAKELSVPVIALSQLNRSLEQRPDKRPKMSDLRESGAIEQDADLITFIYRDEVYNENSVDKGIAEIIIGKQRNGPTGTVKLAFLGQYTKFENYTAAEYGEPH